MMDACGVIVRCDFCTLVSSFISNDLRSRTRLSTNNKNKTVVEKYKDGHNLGLCFTIGRFGSKGIHRSMKGGRVEVLNNTKIGK